MILRYKNYLTAGLFFSQSEREPDLVELYVYSPFPDGYLQRGNPELDKEKTLSLNMRTQWMWNLFNVRFESFANRITNFVAREVVSNDTILPGTRGVKTFISLRRAYTIGNTFTMGMRGNGIEVSGSLMFIRGWDYEGKPLPQIPPLQFTTKISLETKRFIAGFEIIRSWEQNNPAVWAGKIKTPGYTITNLQFRLKINKGINLATIVENLFDVYYREHLSLGQIPSPGRNIKILLYSSIPFKFRKGKIDTLIAIVPNMACNFCAQTIKNVLEVLNEVYEVKVNLQEKRVEVIKDSHLSPQRISEILLKSGYTVEKMYFIRDIR